MSRVSCTFSWCTWFGVDFFRNRLNLFFSPLQLRNPHLILKAFDFLLRTAAILIQVCTQLAKKLYSLLTSSLADPCVFTSYSTLITMSHSVLKLILFTLNSSAIHSGQQKGEVIYRNFMWEVNLHLSCPFYAVYLTSFWGSTNRVWKNVDINSCPSVKSLSLLVGLRVRIKAKFEFMAFILIIILFFHHSMCLMVW